MAGYRIVKRPADDAPPPLTHDRTLP